MYANIAILFMINIIGKILLYLFVYYCSRSIKILPDVIFKKNCFETEFKKNCFEHTIRQFYVSLPPSVTFLECFTGGCTQLHTLRTHPVFSLEVYSNLCWVGGSSSSLSLDCALNLKFGSKSRQLGFLLTRVMILAILLSCQIFYSWLPNCSPLPQTPSLPATWTQGIFFLLDLC
jgi:hypothetical protein